MESQICAELLVARASHHRYALGLPHLPSIAIWPNRSLHINPPAELAEYVTGRVLGIPNVALLASIEGYLLASFFPVGRP